MTTWPGLDVDSLARYLRNEGLTDTGPEAITLLNGGRSNFTYALRAGDRNLILRRPPLGEVTAGAHDMRREHNVLSALANTSVPVPRTVRLCLDSEILGAPFYLMEHAPGRALRTQSEVTVLTTSDLEALCWQLIHILAELHTLDYDAVGLGDFGRPAGFMHRQVKVWRRQLELARTRPLPGFDELAQGLAATVPDVDLRSIVHGDYRLDNCLVLKGRITSVLDWEMSTIGHPLADLATFMIYHDGLADLPNPVVEAPGRLPGAPALPALLGDC